jgi:hypothetical protein
LDPHTAQLFAVWHKIGTYPGLREFWINSYYKSSCISYSPCPSLKIACHRNGPSNDTGDYKTVGRMIVERDPMVFASDHISIISGFGLDVMYSEMNATQKRRVFEYLNYMLDLAVNWIIYERP